MEDKILTVHPITGIITFKDVISDLEIMLEDNELFENIIYHLLESDVSNEDLASLFNYSVTNRLKYIIDVLKDIL